MKLATTTGDFGRRFPDNENRIRALCRAGFRHLDLSLDREADPKSVFMNLQPDQGTRQPVSRTASPGVAVIENIAVTRPDPTFGKTFRAGFYNRNPAPEQRNCVSIQ